MVLQASSATRYGARRAPDHGCRVLDCPRRCACDHDGHPVRKLQRACYVCGQSGPPSLHQVLHPLQSASHCRQQVLAAVGTGRPTALVVDIGNDDTHIIPVVQGTTHSKPGMCWCDHCDRSSSVSLILYSAGEVHDNGAMQLPGLGGANLTKYMATLLQKAPTMLDLDNHDGLVLAAGRPTLVCLSHEKMLNQLLWSDIKHALGYCSTNLELDRWLAAMPQASLPFYDAMRLKGTYLDLLPGELLAAVHHSVRYHSIARRYQAPDGTRASPACVCVMIDWLDYSRGRWPQAALWKWAASDSSVQRRSSTHSHCALWTSTARPRGSTAPLLTPSTVSTPSDEIFSYLTCSWSCC